MENQKGNKKQSFCINLQSKYDELIKIEGNLLSTFSLNGSVNVKIYN